MERLVVERDSAGNIYDASGLCLGVWPSAVSFSQAHSEIVIELMKLGATPDDIIKMKHNGVI